MSTLSISDTQRLTVIKHLASGKSPDVVATITRLDRSTVVDIGSHHGYPDTAKLSWAVDILEKKIAENHAPASATLGHPRPAAKPAPAARPAPPTEALSKPDEIRVLLNTAKAHPSKRIQRAADKVFADLDRLRDLIREDQQKNAERRAEEARKAAARAEIKRLEEQLAAAKAKLRGTTTPATPSPEDRAPEGSDDGKPRRALPRGEHPCPSCDQVFTTPQGRAAHRNRPGSACAPAVAS